MFEAKGIDFSQIPDLPSHYEASAPGVGFAAGGGVAKAVEEVIHRLHPEVEVKTAAAEGLNECRKMLRIARTGKYDGYLLEGMACPGGCIAGAGTVQPPEKSRRALEKYKAAVSISNPMDSQYLEGTRLLYENEADWDRQHRWIVENAQLLHQVFRPLVMSLNRGGKIAEDPASSEAL